eukprot:TRINITY_DN22547_c0_g1_i1.p1 TRINITY_DN22547_c0_g1~~TRINITY_DN22547_c0_g1_i1.p1  ORF type:complete len:277 (-),score=64.24 TRINITY_DN22547_c0_g1_i1:315-1145(-)
MEMDTLGAGGSASGGGITMRGWLSKKGEGNKAKKKRWFIHEGTKLFYFVQPTDKQCKGYIDLSNFSVVVSPPARKGFPFQITVPGRMFHLQAKTEQERGAWISALQNFKQGKAASSVPPMDAAALAKLQERVQALQANPDVDVAYVAKMERDLDYARRDLQRLTEELRRSSERELDLQSRLEAQSKKSSRKASPPPKQKTDKKDKRVDMPTTPTRQRVRPGQTLTKAEISELLELLEILQDDRRYLECIEVLDKHPAIEEEPAARGLRSRLNRMMR